MSKVLATSNSKTNSSASLVSDDDGNVIINGSQQQAGINKIKPFSRIPLSATPATIISSAFIANHLANAIPLYLKKNFPNQYTIKAAKKILSSEKPDRKEVTKNAIDIIKQILNGTFKVPKFTRSFWDQGKLSKEQEEYEKWCIHAAVTQVLLGEEEEPEIEFPVNSDVDGCLIGKAAVPNGTAENGTNINVACTNVQFLAGKKVGFPLTAATNRSLFPAHTLTNLKGAEDDETFLKYLNSLFGELHAGDSKNPIIERDLLNVRAGGGGIILKDGKVSYDPQFKDAMKLFALMDESYDLNKEDQKLSKERYDFWLKKLQNAEGQEFLAALQEMREGQVYLGFMTEKILLTNKLGAGVETKGLNNYLAHKSWGKNNLKPWFRDYVNLVKDNPEGVFNKLKKAEKEAEKEATIQGNNENWISDFLDREFKLVENQEEYQDAGEPKDRKPLITQELLEELKNLNTAQEIIDHIKCANKNQYITTYHHNSPNGGMFPLLSSKYKLSKEFAEAINNYSGLDRNVEFNRDLPLGLETRIILLDLLHGYQKVEEIERFLDGRQIMKIDGLQTNDPDSPELKAILRIVINQGIKTEYLEVQPIYDKVNGMHKAGVKVIDNNTLESSSEEEEKKTKNVIVIPEHRGDSYSDLPSQFFGVISAKAMGDLSLMTKEERAKYLGSLGFEEQLVTKLEENIKLWFFQENQEKSIIEERLSYLERKLLESQIDGEKVDKLIDHYKEYGLGIASISRGQIETDTDRAHEIFLKQNLITEKDLDSVRSQGNLEKGDLVSESLEHSSNLLKLFRPFLIVEKESENSENSEKEYEYKFIGNGFKKASNLGQVLTGREEEEEKGSSHTIRLTGDSRERREKLAEKLKLLSYKANKGDRDPKPLVENFFTECAPRSGTVIAHNLRLTDSLFRFLGIDPGKLDYTELAFQLEGPDSKKDIDENILAPTYTNKAEDVLGNRFLVKENENSPLAKGISAVPKIAPGLGLVGVLTAMMGTLWEIVHLRRKKKIKKYLHPDELDQKKEPKDKAESAINLTTQLGQAISTVGLTLPHITQVSTYPFAWVGLGTGLTAAFLPAGNLQNTLSLLPPALSLLTYSIQLSSSAHGCHNIDFPESGPNSIEAASKLSPNPNGSWEYPESVAGKHGKNSNISIAPVHSLYLSKAYNLERKLTKDLGKIGLSGLAAKFPASIVSNFYHSWEMLTDPNLWDFINPLPVEKVGTVVANKYGKGNLGKFEPPIPHSRPHAYNLLGWLCLATIAGASLANFVASKLNKKQVQKQKNKESSSSSKEDKQSLNLNKNLNFARDLSTVFGTLSPLLMSGFYLVEGQSLVDQIGGPPQSFRKGGEMDKYERETRFDSRLLGNSLKLTSVPLAVVALLLGASRLTTFHKDKDHKVQLGPQDHSKAEKIHHFLAYLFLLFSTVMSGISVINLATNPSVLIRTQREMLAHGAKVPRFIDDLFEKLGLGRLSFKGASADS